MQKTPLIAVLLVLSLGLSASSLGLASSHREAPLIAGDPRADATDLYAFRSPEAPHSVSVIANYLPFQEPAGGPNFYAFDDNVRYDINIDNNGDAEADIIYRFKFTSDTRNMRTFLYNTGPITSIWDEDYNSRQYYTLSRISGQEETILGEYLPVPPSNIGPKSTPDYAALQAEAVIDLPSDVKVFAGQSDDPFFVDLGSLFDLLTIRQLPGNAGGGVDTLKGYNVLSLALQIPITDLTSDGMMPHGATSPNAVIGFWTTSSRQSMSVLKNKHMKDKDAPWVQVSRLGAPLVNEVVIPLKDKDVWNESTPNDDAQFAEYVANPELSMLFNALYGLQVPPQGAFGTASQRDDLIAIFLTGITGLTMPANVVPAEELRLNVGVAVSATPNKLGVLGGDNQGYPNGRRLADDVTDISMRAVAGAAYPLFHPEFMADPIGVQLGDGVDANDASFRTSFPYLALPWSGYESRPHMN